MENRKQNQAKFDISAFSNYSSINYSEVVKLSTIVIVIPTYNPSELLLKTLKDLSQFPEFYDIRRIIVNDGSNASNKYLSSLKKEQNVILIDHKINKGKGAAIKTALREIINTMPWVEYMITVDSDGQHRGSDVLSVFQSILEKGEGVHIGTRCLSKDSTPLRSYIGNVVSRKVFGWMHRCNLHDTQSGLKAYPRQSFNLLLSLSGNRYEFEMEAIIKIIHEKIKIFEIPIATVYFNNNRASHFKPLKDSFQVLWVMLTARMR